jgi:hypothetical protein
MKNRVLFSNMLAITFCLIANLYAQTPTGQIVGHVTDPDGASVPQADLTLNSIDTGFERKASTNEAGFYTVPLLPVGRYRISVLKSGFRTVGESDITLNVNQTLTLDFNLTLGQTTQTVEVTGESPLLQSETSELGSVIDQRSVISLPLNGRNFTQLLTLTPGATPISTSQGSSLGVDDGSSIALPGSGFSNPSIHGQQNRSSMYLLDGILNTDFRTTTYTVLPIIDAVQEFKVQSHNDQAQYGSVLGGIVNLVSQSGTNSYHGSAWEFLRNNFFNARNPFSDAQSSGPAAFRQNEFGVSFGGPIRIPKVYNGTNKTFFFFAYEGWRYRSPTNSLSVVPTSAELSGDFSKSIYTHQIFNPFSNYSPFAGNVIPANLINKQVQSYLQTYFDQPNYSSATFNSINLASQANDSNSYNGRLDQKLGEKDNLWFRWSEMDVSTTQHPTRSVSGFTTVAAKNAGGGLTHVFSPNLVLDVRGGYDSRPFLFGSTPVAGLGPMQTEGFTQLNTLGPVAVNLSGPYGGSGISNSAVRGNPNYSATGNLTWVAGNHTVNFGSSWITQSRVQSGNSQAYTFADAQTAAPGQIGTTGNSLASALLGLPSQAGFQLNNDINYDISSWAVYAQDEWKLTPRITLNVGLRYDKFNQPSLNQGMNNGFDFSTGNWLIGGGKLPPDCNTKGVAPCIPGNGLTDVPFSNHIVVDPNPVRGPNPVNDNWGPRAGIAWKLTDKTVLRAGYAIVYDTLSGISQNFSNSMNTWPDNGSVNTNYNLPGRSLTTIQQAQSSIGSPLPGPSPWGVATWYFDPNWKDPRSQQWNVEIQRSVGQNLMLSVGYVGSHDSRIDYGGLANSAIHPSTGTPAQVNALQPYPWMTPTFYDTTTGWSNYNAFEFRMERRFARGLQFLVSYTWSKSIDIGSSALFLGENGAGASSIVQDYYHPDQSKGVSSYNVPHFLSISALWEPPVGKGKRYLNSGIASWVLGNWQLNTVTQLRSGQPFNLNVVGDVANIGDPVSWWNYERPNLVGSPSISHPSVNEWFNTSAFQVPAFGTFGNVGKNTLYSSNVYNVDFSLFKQFPFGESATRALQLRAEAFNVLNIMNYGVPGSTLAQPNFGQVNSLATSPRQLQLSLKLTF